MDATRTADSESAGTDPAEAAPVGLLTPSVGPSLGVAVEHRLRLATGVALAAAVMTVAWFARALQTGEVLAWTWCLVLGTISVLQLLVVRDSRAPLLLADDQGVRVRHGE